MSEQRDGKTAKPGAMSDDDPEAARDRDANVEGDEDDDIATMMEIGA